MRGGNSANQGRDGQNVLYGDGHVEWTSNPFVGAQRDNIYTYRDQSTTVDDKGAAPASSNDDGTPYDLNDSVLLPVLTP
jgi:prepilin-type processing-associated H-X9-DG protein